MIVIDTIYQKVLAISNKEQRGYITPQEFNFMADKAQLEIFESYFHDMKMAYQKPKNNSAHSDEIEILLEKLQVFRAQSAANEFVVPSVTTAAGSVMNAIDLGSLYPIIYRLDTIILRDTVSLIGGQVVELTKKEHIEAENNPLTRATTRRPTFVREGNKIIKVYHSSQNSCQLDFYYWRRPSTPKWGHVIVNQKPLYNYRTSTNFEIHPSEEENLVTRILQLAGVIIENPQLTQSAIMDEANTVKKQND